MERFTGNGQPNKSHASETALNFYEHNPVISGGTDSFKLTLDVENLWPLGDFLRDPSTCPAIFVAL